MSGADGHTFLFADLAGYTALTEAHGDEQAVALVADFCERVRALLPGHGAHEVKAIGDALMLRAAGAADAVRLGLAVVHDVGEGHGHPAVRVGMHSGPAVERDGDWFGSTVNLAARVSALAESGEVLLTEATRRAAGAIEGVRLESLGERQIKGFPGPVAIFAARRPGRAAPGGHLPIDPVCRMAVDPEHCAGTLVHQGVEYHFCSLECAGRFAARPDSYRT